MSWLYDRCEEQELLILLFSMDTVPKHGNLDSPFVASSSFRLAVGPKTRAVVVHSGDMERTGFFGCSNDLLNKFHDNVVWSMRGNFLGIPTECP